MNKSNQDKLIRELFKVATFLLVLKGMKIASDKFLK